MDQEIYKSLHTHLGIIGFDRQLKITFFNERAAALLGREAQSVIGHSVVDSILPSFISGKPEEFYRQILDGRDVWESVAVPDDESARFKIHFLPLVGSENQKKSALLTVVRVTDKQAKPDADKTTQVRNYIDHSPTYYSVVDNDGYVYFHNKHGEAPVSGKHLKDLLPEPHLHQYLQNIRETSSKNEPITIELPDPEVASKNLMLYHFPIRYRPNKQLVGIIATDVSEIQEKAKHIRQINQLLEKLIELSDQLFNRQPDVLMPVDLKGILEILCKISSSESAFLFRKEENKEDFQLISQYDLPELGQSATAPHRRYYQQNLKWVKQQLEHRSSVLYNDLDDIPEEAAHEREALKSSGVDSLLVTGISIREKNTGYLCLVNLRNKTGTPAEIIKTVEIASYQLGLFFRNYQITRQLEYNQGRYQLLARNISDVVSLQSLSNRCLFMSPSIEKMLGFRHHEFIGRICNFGIHPEDKPAYERAYDKIKNGEDCVFRHRRKHKKGHYLWVETSGRLVQEKDDHFILMVTRAISQQKQAEDELKQREEYFKSLIRSQSNYLIRTDLEGYFTYVNHVFQKKFGKSRDLVGSFSMDTVIPEDHEKTYRMIEECLSAPGKVVPIQLRKPSQDEKHIINYWEFVAITDARGNPTEIQGVGYDITEKQIALQKIEKSEAFLRSLISNNTNPIWALDEQDRLLYANDAFFFLTKKLMGIQFKTGGNAFELLPEAEQQRWKQYYERARTEGTFKDQQKFTYKGRDYFFDIYFSPILNEQGRNIGHSVFAANISDLKETELELLGAKKSLEEAIKTRSTFLSMITHELRTPLNAILGMSDLMQATRLTREQAGYIDTLSYSGKMLNSLINDILDYTSMQAGEFKMEKMSFNLCRVLEQTVNLYQPLAVEKKISLTFQCEEALPENIKGDSVRLGQILNNLVENGLKHTKRGGIHIEIGPDTSQKQEQCLRIRVSDTGSGIPKNRQKEIFEPFRQVNSNPGNYQGGRGLGLAIVTQLVEHNGGSIKVESTPGVGTTFTIRYPYETADQIPDSQNKPGMEKPNLLNTLRVLYIEDMTINQTLMKGIFQNWGSHLDVVSDGYQGLQMVEEYEYDLILLDLLMPKLDGYDTARRIRNMKKNSVSRIPIIAVSAFQGKELENRIREAGINDHISKPIDFQKLHSMILRYTQGAQENAEDPEKENSEEEYLTSLEKLAFKDREQYESFLKNLQNEFANSRQRLEEAVSKGDNKIISFVRHHNYALLSMFGKHEQLLNRLRKLNVTGPNDPEAVSLLDQIKKEFYQLEKYIEKKLEQYSGKN